MSLIRYALCYALLICSFRPLKAAAQGENNVWAFGQKKGLDFNGGDPVLISTRISAYESCASVYDATGALLFYQGTDTGANNCIWDKNHTIMPNGSGIKGNLYSSARQGSCIIPFPDGSHQYYLFTTSTMENILSQGDTLTFLWCSVVNMDLRGGLGDVDPAYKNIVIDTMSSSEALAVARGPDCSVWLIANSPDTLVFNAYKISTAGIAVKPVVSGFPSPRYKIGKDVTGLLVSDLAMSPKGRLMAFNRYDYYPLLELYDFDPASGVFSNRRILDSVYHTLQFSPEGSKLYTSWGDLLQYDLDLLPSIAAVKASKYEVNIYARRTREGPDGKIYVLWEDRMYRINKPELAGAACDFTYYSSLGKPAANGLGLPVLLAAPPSISSSARDTQACFAPEALIEARTGYDGYTWADGTKGRILKMKDPGRTWVRMTNGCTVHIDTILVSEKINSLTAYIKDTSVCLGTSITLNAPANYVRYRWSDGSTGPSAVATPKDGAKWVRSVSAACDVRTDTFRTRFVQFAVDLPLLQSVCPGDTILLDASSSGADTYRWQDGSDQPVFAATFPGLYWVQAGKGDCIAADTAQLNMTNCNNCISIPTAFTPNGDGTNDFFRPLLQCPVLRFEMKMFNRYGEQMWSTNDPGQYWDGTFKGMRQQLGVYFYLIKVRFDTPWVKEELYKGHVTLIR